MILSVVPQGHGKDIDPKIVKSTIVGNIALGRRVL